MCIQYVGNVIRMTKSRYRGCSWTRHRSVVGCKLHGECVPFKPAVPRLHCCETCDDYQTDKINSDSDKLIDPLPSV